MVNPYFENKQLKDYLGLLQVQQLSYPNDNGNNNEDDNDNDSSDEDNIL